MFENLSLTESLSIFFGLYFLAAGLGMLLDREAIPAMFESMKENPAIGFTMGLLAFVAGALVISFHNEWNGILAPIISIFGWIAFLEGLLMLAFRQWFLNSFAFMVGSSKLIGFFSIFTILMGALFVLAGMQVI